METVQVLMSTYNGEKYIREQLDSILKQTYPAVKILIRDDGSSDKTTSILKEYAEEYENITYYEGTNVGVIQSFLQLLKDSDDSAKYYAFADQDDVWLPEKIERAVEKLKSSQKTIPLLYCSDLYVTDEKLNIIKIDDKRPRPSLGNALVQNICTGCTAVMNHALRDIINQTSPVNIVMHDWWFYLVASLKGDVIYDNTPHMYYRQHGSNEWGAKTSRWIVLKHRLKQLTKKRGYIYRQNDEVIRTFKSIDCGKNDLLKLVQNGEHGILGKIRLVLNKQIYRTGRENDLVYRLAVLLGKL